MKKDKVEKKIKILHFVVDDKFVDGEINAFDLDGRFVNEYVLVVKSSDYRITRINQSEKIKILYSQKEAKKYLKQADYDVVFFISLTDYHIVNKVPNGKIVIWWAFGYDLYGHHRFIDIPLYKPLTKKYVKGKPILNQIKTNLKRIPFILNIIQGNKDVAIRKIDFFQPPIPYEYKMMLNYNGFRAKEFYYPQSHLYSYLNDELPYHHNNNIIIGNSATETNNHIDVWAHIKSYIPNTSNIIFPISYGHKDYADYLINKIGIENQRITFLRDFLPKDDYFNIVSSAGYAVYGVLREQAMGGINHCLASGVKLFLFRDSILYKYLKEIGCVVFTIEDIDERSFTEPLSVNQALINRKCLKILEDYIKKITEERIAEIQKKIL